MDDVWLLLGEQKKEDESFMRTLDREDSARKQQYTSVSADLRVWRVLPIKLLMQGWRSCAFHAKVITPLQIFEQEQRKNLFQLCSEMFCDCAMVTLATAATNKDQAKR